MLSVTNSVNGSGHIYATAPLGALTNGTVSLTGNIPGPIPFPTVPAPPSACPVGGSPCVVPLPPFASQLPVPMMEPDFSFILPFTLVPGQDDSLDLTFPGIARVDF